MAYRAPIPVISIGNVIVGGTGKTPVTIELAKRLTEDRGKRVVILSRGYGRKDNQRNKTSQNASNHCVDHRIQIAADADAEFKRIEKKETISKCQPLVVSDGNEILATAIEGGDEPVLMAKALPGVPIVVGTDRAVLAKFATETFHPDVLLMDDGFQHFKLARNLDVVLVNGANPKGNGHVIPRGPLREPFDAIKSAGLAWITHLESAAPGEVEQLAAYMEKATGKPPIFSATSVSKITDLTNGEREEIAKETLFGVSVFLASGIGSPEAFRTTIRSLGCTVVGEMQFGDHHLFSPTDVNRILKEATKVGAKFVLVTAKDAVKLSLAISSVTSSANPPPKNGNEIIQFPKIIVVHIKLKILSGNATLDAALDEAIS